jgi:Carboxypeptidase regulatory-like domain
MLTNPPQHHWIATAAVFIALCLMLGVAIPAATQGMAEPSVRTLSGLVTDSSHEPIRGAIVELRDEKSNEVVTYITGADGHYDFKRLDGNVDYDVRVIFRGRRSPIHNISKFDSHMAKVINFTMRTF